MQPRINSIIPPEQGEKTNKFTLKREHFTGTAIELNFEWGVALFASGIGLYFAVGFEPPFIVLLGVLALCILCLAARKRSGSSSWVLVVALTLVVAGLTRSAWHTKAVDSPVLPAYERAYRVTGWVKSIQASGPRKRWELAVQNIEGLDADKTPEFIRTTTAGKGVRAGDAILIRTVLSKPPGPAVPGGYDPARRAYFERIGGYGYAISKPEEAVLGPLSMRERLSRSIVKFRYAIADRIMAAAPPGTAGLQASLLTGIRTYIPPEQTEALRVAGLAHILAISGLHMGLVAFGIYSLTTLMLACILPLSRRYDVRKFAALVGVLAATSYLVLSGASVATQRAYIMVMIVFLAVILDRRALSMRSVALAAAVTLLLHPEALLGAGFQMSFSAVAALIAVYRWWDNRRVYKPGLAAKTGGAFGSLTVTSFIAGWATAGFAVLHFNRMASYGLAGNLLAMPIFTFWVMPAAIAVFPALLIGQEQYPLWLMGQGLEWVILISDYVASWPGALVHIKAAPSWIIALYGLSFAALCLGPNILRAAGSAGGVLCFLVWALTPTPDLRVSKDGAVAFWSQSRNGVLFAERKRTDSYGREQFTRRAGRAPPEIMPYSKSLAQCDVLACRVPFGDQVLSITASPSEVLEECRNADIVILTERAAGPKARRNCGAVLIDAISLEISGALDVYIGEKSIRLKPALTKGRARRPWG